ncbi:MFS transporter [Bacteriovorax stolpii]|uniref:MFS transporter n=1 Tax=Bacteriovorax stolpii TaxID=960 RepID=UPI00115A4D55|nr:MFS transporter [Bacteriovorax stolpii]QDK42243.1 MFS transporter [Bacteriovorax stolpii]
MKQSRFARILTPTVIISALGYFVDMFDITLFGVVRVGSMQALGITSVEEMIQVGVKLYNWQMGGMLLGGIFWGVLGDKKGRHTVLYASILMYSLANIFNAFVTEVWQYEALRFLAGVGLAGELGAAVTLVAESLNKEDRGLATTLIATLGMTGSLCAALVGKYFAWNHAYLIGGILGLLLLVARFKSFDSEMFKKLKHSNVKRGNLKLLFAPKRAVLYLSAVLVGVPIYFITAILMTLAPEVTSELSLKTPVTAADALIYGSIGLAVGDLASGLLSQWMRSRKKAIGFFLATALTLMIIYMNAHGASDTFIYLLCFLLGTCAGYWAVLVTTAAEQFGTDIRSTVATTVPNFVRGSGMIIATSFLIIKPHFTIVQSVLLIGGIVFALAFLALFLMKETFGRDLDFLEDGEKETETSPELEPELAN